MKKKYILTYDVHEEHERIINDLLAHGWHSVIQGYRITNRDPVICYFPETTWWKEFNSSREASQEFETIAGLTNIIRRGVSLFDDWEFSTTNPLKHQIIEARQLGLINTPLLS